LAHDGHTDPTSPKIDRRLRRQPPRVELALRYAVRGAFGTATGRWTGESMSYLRFAMLDPSENELAAILRRSREIGAAMGAQLGTGDNRACGVSERPARISTRLYLAGRDRRAAFPRRVYAVILLLLRYLGVDMAYFGIYRGTIVNTADPTMKGRVQVNMPAIAGASGWALPCREYGSTTKPPIGSAVWVMFEGGDITHPVWMGCAN
jgi:type VI secretion system (T6SS) baseplate-like injector VgrG